jgi:hypothetical protein
MTLFSMSTASDECAAAIPASASVTTVSGLLMSFFIDAPQVAQSSE